ncbi:MAG: RNA 2',3'-cyclic phosphodiesterase [Elusimicrobia bacterium]|nr:RNA 2',3'-cyclic phosphodiesterase [Elusimicrobiota bacterium]
MRLFFAVAADEEVRAAAAAAVRRLRREPGDYRWVDPRDMHVTLRFLGETPEARLPELEALMRRAAAAAAPFEVVYGRAGAFEAIDRPRVVWIGVDEGRERLEALAAALGRDEPRPYAPHLTLGRNRRVDAPPPFQEALAALPPLGLRRPVEAISLYASRPAPFGHAYEILLRARLGRSA